MTKHLSYLVIVSILFLIALLLFFRAAYGSWRRVACVLIFGQCKWSWSHNERRPLATSTTLMRSWNHQLVGRYCCTRCFDWSDGAARHEQASREVVRENFERESA